MKFNWKGLKLNAFVEGVIESENKDEAMFALKKDGVIGGDDIFYDEVSSDIDKFKKETDKKYEVNVSLTFEHDQSTLHLKIGRASCREKCRSRWSPYH